MDTPFHLTGKTILVTGASSGIGRQTAISCAAMGATVIITGRNLQRLQETLDMLPGNGHKVVQCDLLDEGNLATIAKSLDMVDGVVYSVGIVKPFPIHFLNAQKLNETLHPNFYSIVSLTAALFKNRKIKDGASLVFVSSISSHHPSKGNASYAASKAALEAYAKTLAVEYASRQIRANCVSPAMVKTPMYDYSAAGVFEEVMDSHIQKYPFGVGYPDDVANGIVYLLSPASRWITGINLIMDGGLLLSY